MKTTNLLQHTLPKDLIEARIQKENNLKNIVHGHTTRGHYVPGGGALVDGEDTSTWVPASGLTDDFLHRLACRIVSEGKETLHKELKSVYDSVTAEHLGRILDMARTMGALTRELFNPALGGDPDAAAVPDLRDMILAERRIDKSDLVSRILGGWDRLYKLRKTPERQRSIATTKEGIPVLSHGYMLDLAYSLDSVRYGLDRVAPAAGIQYDGVYEEDHVAKDLRKKLDNLETKGIIGMFQQLYAATKGYSHPMCAGCLYSPKSKTFWYALRPLLLESEDETYEHTFTDMWVRWSPNAFIRSIGTYAENAISVCRTGDLSSESASSSHFHPHVSDRGNICLGDAGKGHAMANDLFMFDAAMDITIGVLNAYQRSDAFVSLEQFTMTMPEWREHNGCDDDDEQYCAECGDEVYPSEGIYCDTGDVWFHDGCCSHSEWVGGWLCNSGAVWSEQMDTYIEEGTSRQLYSESTYAGEYLPCGHDDLMTLWLPDRFGDVPTGNQDVVHSPDPSRDWDKAGCRVFLHIDDCMDFYEDVEDSTYVLLYEAVYHQMSPEMRPWGGAGIWARREDCVCIHITTERENDIPHFVLKLHTTTNPSVLKALEDLGTPFSLPDLEQNPKETTENDEETQ